VRDLGQVSYFDFFTLLMTRVQWKRGLRRTSPKLQPSPLRRPLIHDRQWVIHLSRRTSVRTHLNGSPSPSSLPQRMTLEIRFDPTHGILRGRVRGPWVPGDAAKVIEATNGKPVRAVVTDLRWCTQVSPYNSDSAYFQHQLRGALYTRETLCVYLVGEDEEVRRAAELRARGAQAAFSRVVLVDSVEEARAVLGVPPDYSMDWGPGAQVEFAPASRGRQGGTPTEPGADADRIRDLIHSLSDDKVAALQAICDDVGRHYRTTVGIR